MSETSTELEINSEALLKPKQTLFWEFESGKIDFLVFSVFKTDVKIVNKMINNKLGLKKTWMCDFSLAN